MEDGREVSGEWRVWKLPSTVSMVFSDRLSARHRDASHGVQLCMGSGGMSAQLREDDVVLTDHGLRGEVK